MAGHFATSLKLDASMKERVQRLAQARLRSPHWLMCEAIREFVEREEQLASAPPAEPAAEHVHVAATSSLATSSSA